MNFKLIFNYYWQFLRKRISVQVLILIGYTVGIIGTTVAIPLIYKEIINSVSVPSPEAFDRLSMLVVYLAIAVLVYNFTFLTSDYFFIKLHSRILKELHDFTLEKLQKHSYAFFSNTFVGGMVAKSKRFVQAFSVLYSQFIFHVWMDGITLLLSLFVLWREAWVLGFAFLIWILLYSFLVVLMIKWQVPKSLANAEADTKTISRYADIVTNIITIKMFAGGPRELNEFGEVTKEHEKKRTSAWMQEEFWNGILQSIVIGVFNIIIIWFVIDLWKKGVVTAGTIALVQVYVITSFNIVWGISRSVIRTSAAFTDAFEMVKVFEEEPGVKDPMVPEKLEISQGKIEFKNVSFAYKKTASVFKKLNLEIKSGEKVALVGHSGSGKTTFVKLLLRFIDVQEGRIKIDGQNINRTTQDDLRSQIAYVPQDPSLFHRTIKENISYSKPKARFSEITEVAKKAQAHEFIKKLAKGYNSLVGDRGIKLSGGERQRVAIARAMLKNSPIIVLDEATSSLDSLAEEEIQKAFQELMKDKTTIIIAHRLSTIREMDRIIVFEDGKVKEMGTHKTLLRKKGLYSKLWKSQVGGFIND